VATIQDLLDFIADHNIPPATELVVYVGQTDIDNCEDAMLDRDDNLGASFATYPWMDRDGFTIMLRGLADRQPAIEAPGENDG